MPGPATARKTKIVCTIGPATAEPATLKAMIAAGMDVARLNFSHGDHESHRRLIAGLRRAAAELGREVGVLQDLAGPKIRLGRLENPLRLVSGQAVRLIAGEASAEAGALPVNYPHLLEDVNPGDRILLADGLVELTATGKASPYLDCEVVVGGELSSHKGVNLPTSRLRVSSFTDKDQADLMMGLEAGVDFVALSFVRHEQDLIPLRRILNQQEQPPLLIAKIEKPEAVARFAEILEQVDGIMVARGDLGVEMPLEEVPVIQKRLISQARQAGKVVITATQMLRSMMDSPRPTRAEAADVANAVLDGTDAVMLSDETAVGRYPLEAVAMLDRIARATEPSLGGRGFLREPLSPLLPATEAAISRAACYLAQDIAPAAIVASTTSGGTARLIARFRPATPLVGLTPNPAACRQLRLSWGVIPALIPTHDDAERMLELARAWILEHGLAGAGQRVIVTAGVPLGQPGTTNLLKVMDLE
ncbi:MAG: pyruvate kinase [Thermodesulfobacteriota bacterium]